MDLKTLFVILFILVIIFVAWQVIKHNLRGGG